MPDLINKLSTYAALLGVIGAIGGGFYAWGEFNTKIKALEKKKFVINQTVDLSEINKEIKELHEKINERSNSLGAAQDEDYYETTELIDPLTKEKFVLKLNDIPFIQGLSKLKSKSLPIE